MRTSKALALGLTLFCTACASMDSSDRHQCITVDDAIANVDSVDGADIAVCGFLTYEFEDRNLYASERAARQQLDSRCLSLGKAAHGSTELEGLNGKWVRISGRATSDFCPEGTLCAASCSHIGVFVRDVAPLDVRGE